MSSSVSDKTLQRLSAASYKDESDIKVRIGDHEEVWKPIKIPNFELHNKNNSFDATVYQNEETKQVVIAYRGSQEAQDFYDADAFDVFGGRLRKNQGSLDNMNALDTSSLPLTEQFNFAAAKERAQKVITESQFTNADDLTKEVKKYMAKNGQEGYQLTLTGHSLGGGLGEYAGVMNNVPAVSFEAPNVIDLLPKDKKEKALRGEYQNLITTYGNPNDTVFTGFKGNDNTQRGRIGHLYYTDKPNAKNNNFIHKISRYSPVLTGAMIDFNIARLVMTGAGPNYHSMSNYSYDKYGLLNMPNMYDGETGQRVLSSPRAGEITIRLSVEEVKQIAKDLKREIDDINQKLVQTSNKIINILQQSPASVDGNLINTVTYSVYGFQRGYMERIRSEADFIEQRADNFKSVDEQN
ncbi:lipase family protein [Bacillus paramycoides]|uniref:lipase family protein n=1 Tax=Bacillus paramycoides TaxID=2026194 RepID=UPI0038216F5D